MNKASQCRAFGRFAAALAVTLLPVPALAQGATPQPASFGSSYSKTEAILGGPSRLAAILAGQQGLPAPTQLKPAALSARTPVYAVLRSARPYSPGAANGRPDVFGSVALSVGRTPLDHRWRKVARQPVSGAAASYASSLRGLPCFVAAPASSRMMKSAVRKKVGAWGAPMEKRVRREYYTPLVR